MQITKRNLKFLIESLLNEEDMFSAARKAMADKSSSEAEAKARAEADATRANQQEIEKRYEEELRLTEQFFNETVRSALRKDPSNISIKVDHDYVIFDSLDAEATADAFPDLPGQRSIGRAFERMFRGPTRYFVCIRKGQTITSIDALIKLSLKTTDDLLDKEPGIGGKIADIYDNIGNIPMFTFEQVYKIFEAFADRSGLDIKTTAEEAYPR